jgi:hypothetical protein
MGSKTADRSLSRTLGSSPPTNTVATFVCAAETSFVLEPVTISASSRERCAFSFKPRSGEPSPGVAPPPAGVEDPDLVPSIETRLATLAGRGPG